MNFFADLSEVTRAHLNITGAVAQPEERRLVEPVVVGSSPTSPAIKFVEAYRRLCWPEMPTSYGGKDVWKCLQDMSGSMRTNRDDEDYVDKCEAAIYELATGMMGE